MTTFGQELAEALVELRALAESRMVDTCVVEYATGRKVQNEETGKEELEYAARFASKCRVKDMGFADSDSDVGGRREATGATQVHLPWNMPRVFTDDRITITAIGSSTPDRMLGKIYYVGTDHDHSQATAMRLNVKEAP